MQVNYSCSAVVSIRPSLLRSLNCQYSMYAVTEHALLKSWTASASGYISVGGLGEGGRASTAHI